MTRPSIGLALGGGGARGLAHIGVLRVLEGEGVAIDAIAGTSMGGLVGCLYACGLGIAALDRLAHRIPGIRHILPLTDATLAHAGIFRGQQITHHLTELVGERTLEGLPIRTAVTAVDLRDNCEVVIERGSVVEAIRATIAVPGVLTPVESDGRILVDGGVLNNVPADVARAMGADVVVAVDVHGDGASVPYPRLGDPPLLPSAVSETLDVLYASLNLMMREIVRLRLERAAPEVVVFPPIAVDVTPLNGFGRATEVIAAGEQAMRRQMPLLRRAIERAGGA